MFKLVILDNWGIFKSKLNKCGVWFGIYVFYFKWFDGNVYYSILLKCN